VGAKIVHAHVAFLEAALQSLLQLEAAMIRAQRHGRGLMHDTGTASDTDLTLLNKTQ